MTFSSALSANYVRTILLFWTVWQLSVACIFSF